MRYFLLLFVESQFCCFGAETGRLLKFVEGMDGMKQLFRTLIVTLPGLANVAGLLFLLFFIYAIIGVQLFAPVAFYESYNEQANFRTFGSAMLLLLRMATGERFGTSNIPYCDL